MPTSANRLRQRTGFFIVISPCLETGFRCPRQPGDFGIHHGRSQSRWKQGSVALRHRVSPAVPFSGRPTTNACQYSIGSTSSVRLNESDALHTLSGVRVEHVSGNHQISCKKNAQSERARFVDGPWTVHFEVLHPKDRFGERIRQPTSSECPKMAGYDRFFCSVDSATLRDDGLLSHRRGREARLRGGRRGGLVHLSPLSTSKPAEAVTRVFPVFRRYSLSICF